MIISRTPFRISFFGGGTDYPTWFEKHGGAVLATTINKYCYITCRYLPPFFNHKYRITYSKIEHVGDVNEIDHPSVREIIKFLGIDGGLEIHHDADLPARTGLGSSSSFTVGLLNVLSALKGQILDKMQLAMEAIKIEQEVIKENVGCQDQLQAAFGGFNIIEFKNNRGIVVKPVTITQEKIQNLNDHLMLFFTGFSRFASEIAKEQIKNIPNRKRELKEMHQLVNEALVVLQGKSEITDFGRLLHESWLLKRTLSHKITNPTIDEMYELARSSGAIGGKLLGAGGGGFLLIFAKPEKQEFIKMKMKSLLYVPFNFDSSGSQIIFYNAHRQH